MDKATSESLVGAVGFKSKIGIAVPCIPSKVKQVALLILIVSLGLAAGWLYFVFAELLILALLALAIAMTAGAAQPQRPWLWAAVLSLAIPAAAIIVRLQGQPVQSGRIESAFVAGLASAVLGAYAGALTRRMVTRVFGHS